LRRLVSEGGSSDDKRTSGPPGHPGRPYFAEEVLLKKHCLKKHCLRSTVSEDIVLKVQLLTSDLPDIPDLPDFPDVPDLPIKAAKQLSLTVLSSEAVIFNSSIS